MRLHDVLYVPDLHRNLLSTNKLTVRGGKLMMGSARMTLKLGKLIVTILMVSENGKNLYVLRVKKSKIEEANNTSTMNSVK